MEVKQFQGESLVYQVIEPDNYLPEGDYPMLILLHGYAASMDNVASLSPCIDRQGYLYICPSAPIEFEVRSGRLAYGWSSPESSPSQVEEEEVQAADMLDVFFEEVLGQYRVSPGKVLLLGFSQGGSLSLRCGLPKPETFAGLGMLSGYLPEAGALEARLPAQRSQPIFIAHGTRDQYVPLQEAQDARSFLEGQGYSPLYREYSMRHEVSQQVLEDLAPWIKQVLPPYNGQGPH